MVAPSSARLAQALAYSPRPPSASPALAQLAAALAPGPYGPMGAGRRPSAATFTPMEPMPESSVPAPDIGSASSAADFAYAGPGADSLDWQERFGGQLLEQGTSMAPVPGPLAGLARALTGVVGGQILGRAHAARKAQDEALVSAADEAGSTATPAIRKLAQTLIGRGDVGSAVNLLTREAPERWAPAEQGGRQGQVSSRSNKFEPYPAGPNWQDPGYRQWLESRDAADFGQAQDLERLRHQNRLGEIAAVPREGPIGFNEMVNDPNLGWGQYDTRGQWHDADEAGTGGTITATQSANNAEIDAARALLKRRGMRQEDIIAATKEMDPNYDWRANPNFDPTLKSIVSKATERKIGEDPEFEQFHRTINTPQPTDPALAIGALGEEVEDPLPQAQALPAQREKLVVGNKYKTAQGAAIYLGGGQFELIE